MTPCPWAGSAWRWRERLNKASGARTIIVMVSCQRGRANPWYMWDQFEGHANVDNTGKYSSLIDDKIIEKWKQELRKLSGAVCLRWGSRFSGAGVDWRVGIHYWSISAWSSSTSCVLTGVSNRRHKWLCNNLVRQQEFDVADLSLWG